MKNYLKKALLTAALLAGGIFTSQAQGIATWTGASGGEWNTGANWDIGTPLEGTNAIIPSTVTVNYNLPMTATSFGSLTNTGILNVNTNGFNSGSVFVTFPGGTARLFVNTGAVMNVTGNLGFSSNAVVSISAGSSLTVSGTIYVGSGTNGAGGTGNPNSLGKMTNNGGYINASGVRLNSPNGSVGNGTANLFTINGGTNNLGGVYVGRASGSTQMALDSEGLVINGGVVQMTSLLIGNNSWGLMQVKPGVTVTNTGEGRLLMNGTAGRPARMYQTGGLYVTGGTNYLTPTNSTTAVVAFSVTGGTNYSQGFYFGEHAGEPVANGICNFTNSAIIYVGSGGMGWNGVATVNAYLNSGSILGASADWTNAAPLTMNGGSIDCEDANGTPHNIYSFGPLRGTGSINKIGAGTLTLAGTNIHSGSLFINIGTVAMDVGGILSSTPTIVGSGATFDVSLVPGFTLPSGKTIGGVGTVAGGLTAGINSTISPAGGGAQGTLNFTGGLTASNANFAMELSSDPTGITLTNDAVNITGDLTVSGTNTVVVTQLGSLSIGTYHLIKYSGNFNGSLANFSCSAGTLSNSAASKDIELIVTTVRPTAILKWLGDGSANLWDTATSSNWFNGIARDRSYVGDTNIFDDSSTNFIVNLSGILSPASFSSVLINATNDYTFAASGDISGTTGLTKTNSGKLTILTINDYTGVTTIGGGILSVTNLANGNTSSPIGAANNSAANIVFNGGTLEYLGSNTTIDRSMTLQTNGGTLSITNGTTLTLSGSFTGPGGLTKIGNGQLTLNTAGDYTGGTIINAGTIRTVQGSSSSTTIPITALGSGTVTFNGSASTATYQFGGDGEGLVNNTVNIVGTNNVIQNSGNNSLRTITGNGTVSLNGAGNTLSLTAIDSSAFTGTLYANSIAFVRFFPSTGTVGNYSGATFDLGQTNAFLFNRDGGTYSLGALAGGYNTQLQGSHNSGTAPTTYIIGGNNSSTTYSGTVRTGDGGTGAIVNIIKTGTGTLTLNGGLSPVVTLDPDTLNFVTNYVYTNIVKYTGSTIISNGVLAIAAPALITTSTNIVLTASTSVLDVSQIGYPDVTGTNLIITGTNECIAGQTLAGIGTIRGAILMDAGSTLNLGLPTGTLTVTGSVTLAGTTIVNLYHGNTPNSGRLVSSTANVINYGGDLVVTNVGGALQTGDTFTLFSATSLNGSFNTVTLPSGYTWTTNLGAGTITVAFAPPTSPPGIGSISITGSNISLSATNGTLNGPVNVLSSTNLSLPIANWTLVIATNFDGSGNLNYTIPSGYNAGTPNQFYLLQTP